MQAPSLQNVQKRKVKPSSRLQNAASLKSQEVCALAADGQLEIIFHRNRNEDHCDRFEGARCWQGRAKLRKEAAKLEKKVGNGLQKLTR